MADRPFITRELDRRIAMAQQAIRQGRVNAASANRALMPWAAAEAWIAGQPDLGTSPRDRQSRADHLCPLDDTIAELTRARDTLAGKIERDSRADLGERYVGLTCALRDLHRLHALRQAFAAQRPASASAHNPMQPAPRLPQAQPSLLADMFSPDGKPLSIERKVA